MSVTSGNAEISPTDAQTSEPSSFALLTDG
jgi:hypothetical protein